MMKEIWKPIPKFEGYYEISNIGNVRSLDRVLEYKNGRIQAWKGVPMKAALNEKGYFKVGLRKNGKLLSCFNHTLVAGVFICPRPRGKVINHIDGNKVNNHYTNLEYLTSEENYSHAVRTGLNKIKLNPDIVREIRTSKATKVSLMRKFNVSNRTLYLVIRREIWKDVI